MRFFETGEIYYCSAPVDWRMRMRSLSSYSSALLGINIRDKDCYVIFRNRHGNALRALHYRQGQMMMLEAELDEDRAKYPMVRIENGKAVFTLSREELACLFNRGVGAVTTSR